MFYMHVGLCRPAAFCHSWPYYFFYMSISEHSGFTLYSCFMFYLSPLHYCFPLPGNISLSHHHVILHHCHTSLLIRKESSAITAHPGLKKFQRLKLKHIICNSVSLFAVFCIVPNNRCPLWFETSQRFCMCGFQMFLPWTEPSKLFIWDWC